MYQTKMVKAAEDLLPTIRSGQVGQELNDS